MSYPNPYEKKYIASLAPFLHKSIVSSTLSSICHFTSIATSAFIHPRAITIASYLCFPMLPISHPLTFSPFSHYPFLVLMFHYSYLQCRTAHVSVVSSISDNSYIVRLVNTYLLYLQYRPHRKPRLLCSKAITSLFPQYSPPSLPQPYIFLSLRTSTFHFKLPITSNSNSKLHKDPRLL